MNMEIWQDKHTANRTKTLDDVGLTQSITITMYEELYLSQHMKMITYNVGHLFHL